MDLYASVEELSGIGPKTAKILKRYGICTIKDFFYNLPRDYESFQAPTSIAKVKPGKVVIKGKISNLKSWKAKSRNLTITEGTITDGEDTIVATWFNQEYRAKQLDPDREYYFTGNFGLKNGRYRLSSPSATLVSDVDPTTGISPVYVAHGRLKSHSFKRLVDKSRDKFAEVPDLLPTVKPGTRREALFQTHFPSSESAVKEARDYLSYEELFGLILAAKLNKSENDQLKSAQIPFDLDKIKEFLARLPFKLTGAQKRAAWEIFKDMNKDTPMNRLLQGDVGSGKTMVAAMAAYEAILAGNQVAFLAPTAILATQHYENLKKILEPLRITVALLTGATKAKGVLKKAVADGKINLLIGTHALLTDDTRFQNLGLVIIDEQHRFGVKQRQKLILKSPDGLAPHLLAMTATPIPRSLQLTVFGDLDVSVLDELPKGRKPVNTQILQEIDSRKKIYPKIAGALRAGQQVYWVCKAIEDDTHSEATSVKIRFEKLKAVFPKAKIDFLHGKMKPAEKDEIMEKFARGVTEILVSTTVIEVGVDVPNATIMVIENAEGYGLAQIHQLRGRVGRGSEDSSCYLLIPNDTHPSKRLRELEKSTDGFYLAEVDLKLRGPGEIYGILQHGALDLRIASLSDTRLVHRAQKDVDVFLQNPENMVEYEELMRSITKYQQITTLN